MFSVKKTGKGITDNTDNVNLHVELNSHFFHTTIIKLFPSNTVLEKSLRTETINISYIQRTKDAETIYIPKLFKGPLYTTDKCYHIEKII